jgi:lysyl-tRNA synthetase class 2
VTAEKDWQPSADLATVRLRAHLLAETRAFFAQRQVLEVETPTLSIAPTSDPNLTSLTTRLAFDPGHPRHLHTSPELPMKRLLAAGYGDIFQICRVYRDAELGQFHQPEFTLLEWYRVGMSDAALGDEVLELLARLLGSGRVTPAETLSYEAVFQRQLGLNPHASSDAAVHDALAKRGFTGLDADLSGPALTDLAFSLAVAPSLGQGHASLIVDYPEDQAALAALNEAGLAKRFELFLDGLELANGYGELTDATEQRRRFATDNALRQRRGQPCAPIDEAYLAALDAGLPTCAGVAVGLDRVLMLAAGAKHIDEVMTFPHRPDAGA